MDRRSLYWRELSDGTLAITCCACNEVKHQSEFYVDRRTSTGFYSRCKNCHNATFACYRGTSPAHKRANAKWRIKYKDKIKAQRRIAKDYYNERAKEYAKRHPQKMLAHTKVYRALRSGALIKAPCEICGAIPTEGHHDNYDKPLEVRWLCKKHHEELHIKDKV